MKDDSTNLLRIEPLPIVVCPLSPVVHLSRHVVQKNHVIMFNDRSLPNYDLVKLEDSTLIVTNLASDIAKSHVISETSVPLISIIVKDYEDNYAGSLMLKFEQELTINISQLIAKPMLTYFQFETKLSSSHESVSEEEFSLQHDIRFGTSLDEQSQISQENEQQ
uniref:Uncharacterized protein n=1 Tax=Romanomermis culicivorax TaxID=13658 RepID=A0A915HVG8_ROMCU